MTSVLGASAGALEEEGWGLRPGLALGLILDRRSERLELNGLDGVVSMVLGSTFRQSVRLWLTEQTAGKSYFGTEPLVSPSCQCCNQGFQ